MKKKDTIIKRRIAALINVKTLVTFGLVGLFIFLAATQKDIPQIVENITLVVVSFYFGTQKQRLDDSEQEKPPNSIGTE